MAPTSTGRRGPAASAGFSLLELLVGLLLMTLAVLAAAPLFAHAMHGNAASRDLGWVGVAAERRLEILREVDYDTLVPGGGVDSSVTGYFETVNDDVLVRWQITDNSGLVPGTKVLVVRAQRMRTGYGPAGEVTTISIRGD